MAVDAYGVRFLLHAADLGADYSRSATLGHQSLFADTADVAEAMAACRGETADLAAKVVRDCAGYVDGFLRYLGADQVDSVDASDFLDAKVVHDLNTPIPPELEDRYSIVMEGGTLEHIFDFPTAIRNSMRMVREGGHLVLNLPVNNFPGHGFYQFSPELLFRVLSPRFGFRVRDALVRDVYRPWAGWFRVADPAQLERRVQFRSYSRTVIYVLAERVGPVGEFNPPPQQSDYAAKWQEHSGAAASVPPPGQSIATRPPAPDRRTAAPMAAPLRVSRHAISIIKKKTPDTVTQGLVRARSSARVRVRRSRGAFQLKLWMVWAVPRLGRHPHYRSASLGFTPVHEPWTASMPSVRRRARRMNKDLHVRFGRP